MNDTAVRIPAFDALVRSSRTEGTPIALLEAMAAAVPLVTRVGGVADVVSDAEARLVESEHVAALARASPDVLTNPGQAMARAAAARARLGRAWALTPWLQQRGRSYGAAVEWYA